MQKSTIVLLSIAVLIVALGAILVFSSGGDTPSSGDSVPVEQLVFGQHFSKGSPDSPVSIVEFADFQCPACGATYPAVEKILADYSQQVYFVFRNFPLTQHEHARPAALAAQAAGSQGKFWEMYGLLFQHQDKIDDASLRGYAESLGLDMGRFDEDWKSAASAKAINEDVAAATGFRVSATPTFFINGERYVGVVSYEQFKSKIEKILQKQGK